MEFRRLRAGHVNRDDAEIAVSDQEGEGGAAVHHARGDEPAARAEAVEAVVARTGLPGQRDGRAVGGLVAALEPLCRAALHHALQGVSQGRGNLGRHDAPGLGRYGAQGSLVRGSCRELQAVDVHGRLALAVVGDDAHELGQRIRPIAGAADGGRQRRHQPAEWIALAVPVFQDGVEGLLLEEYADTLVLPGGVPRSEQPVVSLPAGQFAGLHHLRARGIRMAAQIAHQPQLQGMHPGKIAPVGKRQTLGSVAAIQLVDGALVGRAQRQLRFQETGQFSRRAFRAYRQEHHGESPQLCLGVAGQPVERGPGWQPAVLVVVAVQVELALLLGKAPQVVLACRVVGLGQQLLHLGVLLRDVVARQVAHQANEGQIDRALERVLHGGVLGIFESFEIVEDMRAAPGEKSLPGRSRIMSLHCGVQHGLEAGVGSMRQIVRRPAGQRIVGSCRQKPELPLRLSMQALVQIGDDVEIGDQGAQLGGRAQHQLGPGIEIERLVQAVRMHQQFVAVGVAPIQKDAVRHPIQAFRPQQLVPDQAQRSGVSRVGQPLQGFGDALLGDSIDGGVDIQIEPVEAIDATQAQQRQQFRPQRIRGLALGVGHRCRLGGFRQEAEFCVERRIAQTGIDDAVIAEQAQITVAQRFERLRAIAQVVGRPPLGQQQAQELLVG